MHARDLVRVRIGVCVGVDVDVDTKFVKACLFVVAGRAGGVVLRCSVMGRLLAVRVAPRAVLARQHPDNLASTLEAGRALYAGCLGSSMCQWGTGGES